MFKKHFSGNKKFITSIAAVIIAVILLGIIEPIVIENKNSNWEEELKDKNSFIENSAKEIFKLKETSLIQNFEKLKEKVHSLKKHNNYKYELFEYLKKNNYGGFTAEIYNSAGKLIIWNENILADSVSNIL